MRYVYFCNAGCGILISKFYWAVLSYDAVCCAVKGLTFGFVVKSWKSDQMKATGQYFPLLLLPFYATQRASNSNSKKKNFQKTWEPDSICYPCYFWWHKNMMNLTTERGQPMGKFDTKNTPGVFPSGRWMSQSTTLSRQARTPPPSASSKYTWTQLTSDCNCPAERTSFPARFAKKPVCLSLRDLTPEKPFRGYLMGGLWGFLQRSAYLSFLLWST